MGAGRRHIRKPAQPNTTRANIIERKTHDSFRGRRNLNARSLIAAAALDGFARDAKKKLPAKEDKEKEPLSSYSVYAHYRADGGWK